jgi:hypothetical protein
MLSTIALIAVIAVPSSAQSPGGGGLVDFGTLACEGIGGASLFGPRGLSANSGHLVIGEGVQHVIGTQIDFTFTDLEGNVSTLSQSFGQKAAFTTFTCTQEFEEPGGSGELTVTLGYVRPN